MKILITSGGTKIKIDDVRNISNMSKGTFGSAICKSFLNKGHTVDFLMAKDSKSPFKFEHHYFNLSNDSYKNWNMFCSLSSKLYAEHIYTTFSSYAEQLENLLKNNKYDMVVLAAAVSDYEVKNVVNGKMRSGDDNKIELVPLPKLISTVKKIQPDTFLVGFKLMVGASEKALINHAEMSIEKNGCNVVIANDLQDIKNNNHKVLIVDKNNVISYTKDDVEAYGITLAEKVVDRLIDVKNR